MPILMAGFLLSCNRTLSCESQRLYQLAEAECAYHYECDGVLIGGSELESCAAEMHEFYREQCLRVGGGECEAQLSRKGVLGCLQEYRSDVSGCGIPTCYFHEGEVDPDAPDPFIYYTSDSCSWSHSGER